MGSTRIRCFGGRPYRRRGSAGEQTLTLSQILKIPVLALAAPLLSSPFAAALLRRHQKLLRIASDVAPSKACVRGAGVPSRDPRKGQGGQRALPHFGGSPAGGPAAGAPSVAPPGSPRGRPSIGMRIKRPRSWKGILRMWFFPLALRASSPSASRASQLSPRGPHHWHLKRKALRRRAS